MITSLRGRAGRILGIGFMLAFALWMIFELSLDVQGRGTNMQAGEIGRVNGRPVLNQAFQEAYQELYQQYQQQSGGELTAEQQRELREAAWERVVGEMLIQQEIRRLGVRATDAEVRLAALTNPHPALMQNEIFLTDGQFDPQKYRAFFNSPAASDEMLLQLEQYYRQTIPRSKLFRQVAAGVYVSDAELWRAWKDRNETATVDYVSLDLGVLAPGDETVTDAEIRRRYEENRERFRRPATARLTLAVLPTVLTPADTAATLERVRQIRQEIMAGADFAEVAQRESTDPGSREQGGDLGMFSRGQMVPAFEETAFSLPVGAVSEPVLTPFGFHLIKVEEKQGDQVRARHILVPIQRTEAALERLDARADSLEELARRNGVERAARALGAEVRRDVVVTEDSPFVPGVGSALEAVEWAQEESRDEESRNPVSEVLESEQALYVARLEAFTPAGILPLAEAAPQIRRELILEKKKEKARQAGQQILAEIRGGKTLEQAVAARNLRVERTGPFRRVDPNPVLGQANAVVGASFGVPLNRVSGVVESPAGLFLVRPVERTEADRAAFEAQKAEQRAGMTAQMREQAVAAWLQSLRESAEVEDRRSEVFTTGI